jgi:ferric-dicitrate binding protein FerR (iron transport regulator)
MSKDDLRDLLSRYLDGSCTREEAEAVEQWYGILDHDGLPPLREIELDMLQERIWNAIATRIDAPMTRTGRESTRRLSGVMLAIAAIFTGLMVLAGAALLSWNSVPAYLKSGSPARAVITVNDTRNAKTLVLPDGTEVTLQPQSKLAYPKRFARSRREVFIEGEALFNVERDTNRPFLVYNNNLTVRVVGTIFGVKTDRNGYISEVSVRRGKVAVRENKECKRPMQRLFGLKASEEFITQNQKVVYARKSRSLTPTLVEEPEPLDGISENFVFRQTPLIEVVGRLTGAYGIKITIKDSDITKYTFTGDLSSQKLFSMLDFLCMSIDATYRVSGTEIVIERTGSKGISNNQNPNTKLKPKPYGMKPKQSAITDRKS